MVDRILRDRFREQPSYSTPRIIKAAYKRIPKMYEPLISSIEMAGYLAEYDAFLADCKANKRAAFNALMKEL